MTIVITNIMTVKLWKFRSTEPSLILEKNLGLMRTVRSEYVRLGTYCTYSLNIGMKIDANEYSAAKIIITACAGIILNLALSSDI